jgi:hypothetical protein
MSARLEDVDELARAPPPCARAGHPISRALRKLTQLKHPTMAGDSASQQHTSMQALEELLDQEESMLKSTRVPQTSNPSSELDIFGLLNILTHGNAWTPNFPLLQLRQSRIVYVKWNLIQDLHNYFWLLSSLGYPTII